MKQTNSFLDQKISYCFSSTSGLIVPKVAVPKTTRRDLHLYLLMGIWLSWLKSLCFLFFSSFLRSFSEELCFDSCPLLPPSSCLFASFPLSFSLSFSALLKWPVRCTNPVNIHHIWWPAGGSDVPSTTTDKRMADFPLNNTSLTVSC